MSISKIFKAFLASLTLCLILGLSACAKNQTQTKADQLKVVTTTDFYGEVAQAVLGSHGKVTPIITSPSVDPHDYEPTTKTAKLVAKADLAVYNGLEYDSWIKKLGAKTYTALDVSDGLAKIGQNASANVTEKNNTVATDASEQRIDQILRYRYPHLVATKTTAYQSVTDVKRVFEDPDTRDMARWDYDQQQRVKTQGIYLNNNFDVPAFIQQTTHEPVATEIGTATHLVFQKLPLDEGPINVEFVDQEIQKLVGKKLINPARINRKGIVDFYQTEVGQKILKHPADYHREVPFSMIMNGHELFKGVNVSDDERILIHGIIDGYLKNDEGIVLVDYKTDHLNKDYRDFDLARIKDRYRGQLELYKEALNLMEGIPVVQMGLYLLELGEFVLFTKEGD